MFLSSARPRPLAQLGKAGSALCKAVTVAPCGRRRGTACSALGPAIARANVVVPGETMEAQLARAKGYPYPRPSTSFLFVAGDVFLFDNSNWRGLDQLHDIPGACGSTSSAFAASRGVDLAPLARGELYTPVLAIGSNAGPEQLRRKYPPHLFPGCVIPVIQVALEDFDVVYTPYISSYGSCTATLEYSPGTVTSIFVTYLTRPLMKRMDATEGGYNLCRLSRLRLHVAPRDSAGAGGAATAGDGRGAGGGGGGAGASWELLDWVYQYNYKKGSLELPVQGLGATPVAIAEIPARNRAFPAVTQTSMLGLLREALGEGPNSRHCGAEEEAGKDDNDDEQGDCVGNRTGNGCGSAAGNGNGNGNGNGGVHGGSPRSHGRASAGNGDSNNAGKKASGAGTGTSAGNGKAALPLAPVQLPPGPRPMKDTDAADSSSSSPDLDSWILRNIQDDVVRRAAVQRLQQCARPFRYPHCEVVAVL